MRRSSSIIVPSRRDIVRLLGLAGASSVLGRAPFASRARASAPTWEEIPPEVSGITWVHENAMSSDRHLPETMGPGVAFFDYDNDGWVDIFMVNSGEADFYKPSTPLKHALYKNNRDGTFTDVTDQAGVAGGRDFGMGCAIADYDNDGYQDILVTAYGRCTLYHNNGDGTFTDVTDKAGVAAPGWTTSAVWFDYDNDGKLDLFLCSFVEWSVDSDVFCGDNKLGRRFYCIPRVFKPTPSLLFRNNGDGTFTEVSAGTDIARSMGKALGVVATDINNDGLMDLFVANDTVQNFLFVNRGNGKWDEIGLPAEVAFSANGTPRSGMGVDAADVDGNGLQDLFVANVDQEMFSLYKNQGERVLLGSRRLPRHLAGHAPAERLGAQVLRLRQRRPDRPLPGQRPSRRHDRAVLPAGALQDAAARVQERRHEAAERQRRVRAGLREVLPRARADRGRLQQRRPRGRPHRQQRRGARAAQEQRGHGPPLGRRAPARDVVQPGRDRRDRLVVGWGHHATAPEDERRELPVVPRHARGAGPRHRDVPGLARDHLAAAERPRRALHGRADRPLRHHRRGQGPDRQLNAVRGAQNLTT
jgi:hypothetical protein